MAAPLTKRFSTLVSDFAASAQATSAALLDFSVGSILRALAEATADLGTWLQKLYLFALSVTRLSTSQGVWVDTWVNDFTLTRLPAIAATGLVTFSRYTATDQAVVPVGAQVATQDGTKTFTVYADLTNLAYNPTSAPGYTPGYVVPALTQTIVLPVRADVAGSGGNVSAATITSLRSSILGIDAVVNANPFTTGLDAETDAALRARFRLFIASLSKATDGAIGYAIVSLSQGLQYQIVDTVGLVTVYVDDGSGEISTALVNQCQAAVDKVRAGGVQAAVLAATKVTATVSMALGYDPAYYQPSVVGQVQVALANYINGLGLGVGLRYTALEHVAYGIPGVTNVTNVQINGGTADIAPSPSVTIKAGTMSVV